MTVSTAANRNRALYTFVAAVAAIVPAYLFYTVREPPASTLFVFIFVVGVAVAFLPQAYAALHDVKEKKLAALKVPETHVTRESRSRGKEDTTSPKKNPRQEAEDARKAHSAKSDVLEALKQQVCLASSVWQVNLSYIVTVLALNFYFLKNAEPIVSVDPSTIHPVLPRDRPKYPRPVYAMYRALYHAYIAISPIAHLGATAFCVALPLTLASTPCTHLPPSPLTSGTRSLAVSSALASPTTSPCRAALSRRRSSPKRTPGGLRNDKRTPSVARCIGGRGGS